MQQAICGCTISIAIEVCIMLETLLSLTDIIALLSHFLPHRAANEEEVIRQIEERHKKRYATMKSKVVGISETT
jgi:hypothetical protein